MIEILEWVGIGYISGIEETVEMMKWFWMVWLLAYVLLASLFNETIYWYHKWLYRLPVIKFIGKNQFKRGHRFGATWGLEEGHKLGSGGSRKLPQRKIKRALERAGM